MKNVYSTVLNRMQTSPNVPVPGREKEMTPNMGGGFAFQVTPFTMLERFLVLGSDKPTYYASAQKLTKNNADNILACLKLDGRKTVDMIVDVSIKGRAPKNDPALFALAVAAAYGDDKTKSYALDRLSDVARIGTDLFHFLEYINSMRGWGRALKRAVANWYLSVPADKMAYQLLKYQQRDGWSNRDALCLSHPKTDENVRNVMFNYIMTGKLKVEDGLDSRGLRLIEAFEKAKVSTSVDELVRLITDFNLTHEMIPTQFKSDKRIWEALLQKMPIGAMTRNLANMTRYGLLVPMGDATRLVIDRLNNAKMIKDARLHPIKLLNAYGTYKRGKGLRGQNTWSPVNQIVEALESAFYLSFDAVEPTGKKRYMAIDCSGSMGMEFQAMGVTYAEVAACLAMVEVRREQEYCFYGFCNQMVDLGITKNDTLAAAARKTQKSNWGSTNASLPMLHALERKIPVDVFEMITDNDVNSGTMHPFQALQKYRGGMGRAAKMVVIAMTPTNYSIADPRDGGMLDVVGFDTSVPTLVNNFILGGGKSASTDEDEVDE